MSCDVWNLVYFGSASQPAYHSQNSRAAQPAGYPHKGKAKDDKGNGRRNGKGMPKGKCGNGKSNSKGSGKIAKATAKAYVKAWHMQKQKHGKRKGGNSSSNSIDVRRAATPVDGDSSAARPADDLPHGKGNDKTALDFRTALRQVQIGTKDVSPTDSHARNLNTDVAGAAAPVLVATSLNLFARLPYDIWRKLVGLLSYSDVASLACCISHKDTDHPLIGYMRRRCCISTFKRLLAEYGAITTDPGLWHPDYGAMWDSQFWKRPEERKHFWKRAIEIIFTYEPKSLLGDKPYQRCDPLIHQDYIHSCGVLFASEAFVHNHRVLQRQFRLGYGAFYGSEHWFPLRGFQYCVIGLNPLKHTVLDGLLL